MNENRADAQILKKELDSFCMARDFLGILSKMKMTRNARVIFYSMLSTIHAKEDKGFKEFQLTLKQFQSLVGTDYINPTAEMNKALNQLGTSIEYDDPIEKVIVRTSLVSSTFLYGEGKVFLTFDPVLKPMLLSFQKVKSYLKGSIDYCLEAQSQESVLFYLYAKSSVVYKDDSGVETVLENPFTMSICDFKKMLNIEGKYPRTDTLKKSIILPLCEELNNSEYLDIYVEYLGWKKKGKVIEGIEFKIKKRVKNTPILPNFENSFEVIQKDEGKGTKEFYLTKCGYSKDDYRFLSALVDSTIKSGGFESVEVEFSTFKWWDDTKSNPIYLRSFRLLLMGVAESFSAVEQVIIHDLIPRERDGRAKGGAFNQKLKSLVISNSPRVLQDRRNTMELIKNMKRM